MKEAKKELKGIIDKVADKIYTLANLSPELLSLNKIKEIITEGLAIAETQKTS